MSEEFLNTLARAETAEPSEGRVGQVIGDYRVVEELGAGGMGVVYRAEHVLLGRQAALKVLRPELSAHESMVQRFFNEARAASSIRHPGIVEVYDFGYHRDGSAFIVMAYLDGQSLESRLADGAPLSVGLAVRIAQQVVSALSAAHAQGIVHRDLKPDNIFMAPDPDVPDGERAKLLDFGIAKLAPEVSSSSLRTQTGAIMGSPQYMSPEQCQGAETVDVRTDFYALGCVLYRMVCGRLPFEGRSAADIIAAHLRDAPPPPRSVRPEISPELETLILALLEKEPDGRPSTARELKRALAGLPEAPPSTTSTADRIAPEWLSARGTSPTGRIAFLGLIALASAVAVYLLWPSESAAPAGEATAAVEPAGVVEGDGPSPGAPETAPRRAPAPPPAGDAVRDEASGLLYSIAGQSSEPRLTAGPSHLALHHERWWTNGALLADSRSLEGTPLIRVPKREEIRDVALRLMAAGETATFWYEETAADGETTHHAFEIELLALVPKKRTRPLSDAEVTAILGHYRGALEKCEQNARARQVLASGELRLRLALRENGRVRPEIITDEIGDAELSECTVKALRAARLPSTGNRRVMEYTVQFPLNR